MNKLFQVGNRVKFFEPVGKNITYGIIEEINKWMSICEDGFDGKVSMSAKKIDGRWFAFSLYDREWNLEVYFEDKFLPGIWIKIHVRKFKNQLLKLT